ncbi:MAG: hypothetical protein H0T63_10465, partial [Pyrinomonadaceae bacterium]|nr:hypothetical protein [Pyrinomonadaceae bacterium]
MRLRAGGPFVFVRRFELLLFPAFAAGRLLAFRLRALLAFWPARLS